MSMMKSYLCVFQLYTSLFVYKSMKHNINLTFFFLDINTIYFMYIEYYEILVIIN